MLKSGSQLSIFWKTIYPKIEGNWKNSEIEISTFEPDDYIREACLNLHIFRNYPYSEKLFTLKLKAIEKVSEIEISTFELEAIR